MRDLHVIVSNKVATYLQRDGNIVCGNSDYQIIFAFDSEWDEYTTKTARFKWNGKYEDVKFTGNTVKVPILKNTKLLEVGVYAEKLSTTTPAEIACQYSILCGNEENRVVVFKTKTITQNGTYRATDDEANGYSVVSVDVPQKVDATLIAKVITENGVYNAAEELADGYSSITVNVDTGDGDGNVIEVEALPEEGTENTAYMVRSFVNIIACLAGEVESLADTYASQDIAFNLYKVSTRPSENVKDTNAYEYHWYYIEDENEILAYYDSSWRTLDELIINSGLSFKGEIADISEATENGYYALMGGSGDGAIYLFANGEWCKYEKTTPAL